MKKVYLAGPAVFAKDPKFEGEYLKDRCAELGLVGLFPFDNEVTRSGDGVVDSYAIFDANLAMIEECDGVLANVNPFRGPSCDPGTAFEIGYARALGKPIVGYWAPSEEYKERLKRYETDNEYPRVEDFGLPDNLMIYHGCDCVLDWRSNTTAALIKLKSLIKETS